jgi:hypothetical protein
VTNPRRAGGPERGDADSSAPEDLETQAVRDVNPAQRVVRDRARIHEALVRTEEENALKGRTPGRHRRVAPARV